MPHRSTSLTNIAKTHQPHAAIVADSLHLPHPFLTFDFCICIAVIHHLSTPARRVEAIRSVLQTLRPRAQGLEGGRALLYVWALEQRESRRGWDEGDAQDVMVPWVLKGNDKDRSLNSGTTFQRYYHLYRKGELEDDIMQAGGSILEAGYEKDNWWAIACSSASS